MCGITGFISSNIINYTDVLNIMISKMNHRGSDSNGIYYNENFKVGLGHARLSIVDLSETGHQPMISPSNRYKIVFNGEVYNHLSIRNKLNKEFRIDWKGTSDTETILIAIEKWGLDVAIDQLVGMFAIALIDEKKGKLSLVRDRMGEKPLYYGWVNNNFVFASDIKSISSVPLFSNRINRNSLALFLKHSSIPEPYSIYENVFKLEAGHILTINISTKNISKKEYWSTTRIANKNSEPKYKGSPEEAVFKLDELLTKSVGEQMQADVPLGAFLSGGVDSSAIVALMQKQSKKKINTFSIGFEQKEYNEAEYAKQVADHIGTNHHDMYMSNKDVLDIVPKMPQIYTEPFSEASLLPTFLVSKIAKEKVTVSLTGDAGDELFCGYDRYRLANKSWNKSAKIPYFIRKGISTGITNTPKGVLGACLFPFKGKKSRTGKEINLVDKVLKMSPLLGFKNREEFYHLGFMSHNLQSTDWVLNSENVPTTFNKGSLKVDSYLAEMMATDLITYLPNNNLTKVDRAAMANSLETRVPMLDHRIVEFAMSLPLNFKIREGVDKWVLREVLYKYVPKKLIERPKMGFAVPLAEWLRGALKDWCENLINEKRLKEEGFFNVKIVRNKWKEHLSKKRNWENQLWDVIVFQAWLDEQKK
ncbi:asparagine synthase (glutamine-hydrolyzing) [Tenacibaculum retecalamus]|uniref:asparagine synthase (glutamine-hydrolyzing) n=1 Tax=Tenacibaculum retecalamus TaxID=3018315 RepID=UPI0023D93ADC|nr:asparagine synthase (glutamine-hydrolyzing) [Tenacibaculum retecalamus]WBX70729.1 asparagine synthase (glutamine-hydrolyzing) [Tenacibaculum retecalamus]